MTELIARVMMDMSMLYAGDAARIQHFTKVYAYAGIIGREEGMNEPSLETLCLAALTHDIGIHLCEEKYGCCDGALQQKEGPALAKTLLSKAGAQPATIERVCFLVAHHHTAKDIDALDWQVLLEADFLVNGFEESLSQAALENAYDTLFVTQTGKQLLSAMFDLNR